MPKPFAGHLPTRATAGQIAAAIGRSERVILGRAADGRLPRAIDGGIDVGAILRAGVDELSRDQRTRGRGGITARDAQEADYKLERLAVWLAIREARLVIAREALAVGIPLEQVRALDCAMTAALPEAGNRASVELMDTPSDPELGPFSTLDSSCEPKWTALTKPAAKGRR